MNKTYKFRIYPTKNQTSKLNNTLEICRLVYNDLLSKRNKEYDDNKKTLSCYTQQKYITQQKSIHPKMKEINSQVLQNVAVRVDLAFQGFFRRVKSKGEKAGFPRFKSFNRYQSITYPQNNGSFSFQKDCKIKLSKIGCVKIKKHRDLKGTPKTCTVIKTSTDKWFISITCINVEKKPLPVNDKIVGIDLGISTFATYSNGTKINNPKFFKDEIKSLTKSQRKLSKLKKGTKERKQQIKVVARIHERTKNKRDNFSHQLSRKLINKFDLICVEDLNINRMKITGKRIKINRSIQDVAWRNFLSNLVSKAEEAERQIMKVNPAYTSQTCSECYSRQKLVLSDRTFKCNTCGLSIDRDLNASINILRLGQQSLESKLDS